MSTSKQNVAQRFYLRCLFLITVAIASVSHTGLAIAAGDVIKSPNDDREYLAFTLKNGLSALVISDPNTDQAAASLDVSVGHGDDPENFLGLAHFLEHMLFLGTTKFPQADEYQTYIDQHGGAHNAFTAYDRTNYYFNIDQQYLEPAIDRFSQFFIAPLFTPEYVEREKNAVHSEYQSRRTDEFRRSFAVFKQVINPAHPQAKFSIGSLDTLADKPEETVREALLKFYDTHYSAEKMSLVILGNQPASKLKALAEQYFATIPTRKTSTANTAVPLFEKGTLPKLLRIKSLQDKHRLSLLFPVPSVEEHYRVKPLRYISAILGDESQGSLVQVLKDKGWVEGLGAGEGFAVEGTSSLMVSVTLTPEGYAHYEEIISLIFAYIDILKANGVDPVRYEQEAALNEIAFRFQEKSAPSSYAIGLSNNLKHYPVQDVIYGDYVLDTFNAALIQEYADALTPDNVLISLSSATEKTDHTERWYGTEYRVESWQLAQQTAAVKALNQQLALPATNPFIPEDFNIRTSGDSNIPRVIKVEPGFRLWHQLDADFPTPKSNIYFTFRSPIANDSAMHNVATQLYVSLVNKALNTELYPAQIVGHSINLYNHSRGFSLRLQGYRDKQDVILARIARTIKHLEIDPKQLAIAKESLRLRIENKKKGKPYHQAIAMIYPTLLNPSWSDEEQLAAIEWVTPASLQRFATEMLGVGEIDMLAHGNLTTAEAIALSKPILQRLHQGIEITSPPPATVRRVATTGDTIELQTDHTDNAFTLYAQAPDSSIDTQAQYRLLEQMLGSRYYNELRTEEQLGYTVFANYYPVYDAPGLAFIVQSPVATADELVARTQRFIDDQIAASTQLTNAQLERYKSSLLSVLLQRDTTLDNRTNRYWQELDRGYVFFNSKEWLAKAIRRTTVEDLKTALTSLKQNQLIIKALPKKSEKDEMLAN